jgi:pantoate--beta-alanine ligase
MDVVKTPAEMQKLSGALREKGAPLGLVPTMGALHEGHLSLIRRAVAECPAAVVSIFVNPAQFAPGEDFGTYPRTFESDLAVCREESVAAIYAPAPGAVYESGFDTWVEVPTLAARLCGPHRPGHFRGVATVVAKLFAACRPDRAYFGEKDYQQLILIRRMAADLNLGVEVISCPTVREEGGLAMSSRNSGLGAKERERALSLSRGLRRAVDLFAGGEKNTRALIKEVCDELEGARAEVDYVEVVHPDTLEPLEVAHAAARIAAAVRIGGMRLIDNMALEL